MSILSASLFANEIRQFDVVTTERLGNEIVRMSERRDRGATTAAKKRAKESATAALRGKLYDGVHYDYVILNDPTRDGLLVYALAIPERRGDVITGGHYRVTVSADGIVAKRVELLSQLIHSAKPDPGNLLPGISASQVAGKLPVETWIYSSYVYHIPMFVAVVADGSIWGVANGRIVRADEKGPKNHLDILNKTAPEVPR
jgi:hypothetical protein